MAWVSANKVSFNRELILVVWKANCIRRIESMVDGGLASQKESSSVLDGQMQSGENQHNQKL